MGKANDRSTRVKGLSGYKTNVRKLVIKEIIANFVSKV